MDREQWLERCAARYEARAGLSQKEARDFAEVALDSDEDGDFVDTPEEAADADMECWDDDGD